MTVCMLYGVGGDVLFWTICILVLYGVGGDVLFWTICVLVLYGVGGDVLFWVPALWCFLLVLTSLSATLCFRRNLLLLVSFTVMLFFETRL